MRGTTLFLLIALTLPAWAERDYGRSPVLTQQGHRGHQPGAGVANRAQILARGGSAIVRRLPRMRCLGSWSR